MKQIWPMSTNIVFIFSENTPKLTNVLENTINHIFYLTKYEFLGEMLQICFLIYIKMDVFVKGLKFLWVQTSRQMTVCKLIKLGRGKEAWTVLFELNCFKSETIFPALFYTNRRKLRFITSASHQNLSEISNTWNWILPGVYP